MSYFYKLSLYAIGIGLISNVLSGCGLIGDRTSEYIQAERSSPIELPEGLDGTQIRSRYPIPEVSNQKALAETFKLPEPPDATAALGDDPYLIESVEENTWLHLFAEPGKVWPLLELFWSEYDLAINAEDVKAGFIATQKLESSEGNTSLMQDLEQGEYHPLVIEGMSFQTKLIQGVRRNTTEIQVRGLLPSASVDSAANWIKESINPRLEKGILDLMGKFITSENLDDRHSLLANDIGHGSRVRLAEDEAGQSFLELRLSFQRAWNELSQALDAAGIVVAAQDRSEKAFYISYLSEEDLESWFSFASTIEEKRLERNLALRLNTTESGAIIVTVELLNPEFDIEQQREVLSIVFEHIS